MFAALLYDIRRLGQRLGYSLSRRLVAATAPSSTRLVVVTLADLPRCAGRLPHPPGRRPRSPIRTGVHMPLT